MYVHHHNVDGLLGVQSSRDSSERGCSQRSFRGQRQRWRVCVRITVYAWSCCLSLLTISCTAVWWRNRWGRTCRWQVDRLARVIALSCTYRLRSATCSTPWWAPTPWPSLLAAAAMLWRSRGRARTTSPFQISRLLTRGLRPLRTTSRSWAKQLLIQETHRSAAAPWADCPPDRSMLLCRWPVSTHCDEHHDVEHDEDNDSDEHDAEQWMMVIINNVVMKR